MKASRGKTHFDKGGIGELHFALKIAFSTKYERLSHFTITIVTAPQNYARRWSQKSQRSILVPKYAKHDGKHLENQIFYVMFLCSVFFANFEARKNYF